MDWRSKESGPNKYPSLHLQKHLGTEHPFSTAPGDDKHIMHIYVQYMVAICIICGLYTLLKKLRQQQQYYSTMYYSPLCYSVCKSLSYALLEPTNSTAQPAHLTGESLVWNGIPPIPPLLQSAPKVETSSSGITMCWIRELSYRGWDEAGLWSEECTVQSEDKKYFP